MEIKTMFNNWYKVMKLRPDIKMLDKKLVYEIWLDGYGIAIAVVCEEKE